MRFRDRLLLACCYTMRPPCPARHAQAVIARTCFEPQCSSGRRLPMPGLPGALCQRGCRAFGGRHWRRASSRCTLASGSSRASQGAWGLNERVLGAAMRRLTARARAQAQRQADLAGLLRPRGAGGARVRQDDALVRAAQQQRRQGRHHQLRPHRVREGPAAPVVRHAGAPLLTRAARRSSQEALQR